MTEKEIPQTWMQNKLLNEKGYRPYCGATTCIGHNPRTYFNGLQFKCPACGWTSQFPREFIEAFNLINDNKVDKVPITFQYL